MTCQSGLGGCTALHRDGMGSCGVGAKPGLVVQPPKPPSMTHTRQRAHEAPQSSDDGACHRIHRWLVNACAEPDSKPDAVGQRRNASILSQTWPQVAAE